MFGRGAPLCPRTVVARIAPFLPIFSPHLGYCCTTLRIVIPRRLTSHKQRSSTRTRDSFAILLMSHDGVNAAHSRPSALLPPLFARLWFCTPPTDARRCFSCTPAVQLSASSGLDCSETCESASGRKRRRKEQQSEKFNASTVAPVGIVPFLSISHLSLPRRYIGGCVLTNKLSLSSFQIFAHSRVTQERKSLEETKRLSRSTPTINW